ncbi:Dihydropyrimidine dehydrogenase [NADP(+)] [Triplophysa tibetana]|uniref:Dihydropyrimidine dehydrogenase [NADP(+)] n=1 Tax=Triplophysa tibetana TaxID=1572043 RepID=A0A5A9N7Y2_9TELE|nr:Dihydropyrimidine dehydrogenase [NADP(+)] [Triplophysa tibetana]
MDERQGTRHCEEADKHTTVIAQFNSISMCQVALQLGNRMDVTCRLVWQRLTFKAAVTAVLSRTCRDVSDERDVRVSLICLHGFTALRSGRWRHELRLPHFRPAMWSLTGVPEGLYQHTGGGGVAERGRVHGMKFSKPSLDTGWGTDHSPDGRLYHQCFCFSAE